MSERTSLFHDAAHKVYDVLVAYAGAADTASMRMQFDAFWGRRFDASEFRFCGSLGFGGKLWVSTNEAGIGWYVSCYPEDLTPEREATIQETNIALTRLLESLLASSGRKVEIA
jgi:hypothetical protein